MNAAQILRLALHMCDAVNQNSTTDPYWTQAEMLAMCNDAKEKAEMALRQISHLLAINDQNQRTPRFSSSPWCTGTMAGTPRTASSTRGRS